MNNWIKRLCTAAFFPAALTCILLALWLFPPAVPVDNITPAEDIISREYSLERLLLTKAIFDVRHGSLRGKPESCWNAGGRLQSGNTIMLWKGAAINAFSSLMKTIFCMML